MRPKLSTPVPAFWIFFILFVVVIILMIVFPFYPTLIYEAFFG